jgi:predicted DCC family thiol-disulfide oxidoreductase YuxK
VLTAAPGRDVLLYDGDCPFCRREAGRLLRWLPEGALQARSFREPGVLDAFPGLDAARCEKALQLVRADGRVFAGAEGVVQALRHRRLGLAARAYYLPGLRQLANSVYAGVARRRFRLGGAPCLGCTWPGADAGS